MIALVLAGELALAAAENRARLAEIEVGGPVRNLVLSAGSAGECRVEGELVSGERVRLSVPVPVRGAISGATPDVKPRIDWTPVDWTPGDWAPDGEARGSARFLGWGEDASGLDRLPPGILARPRPPVEPEEVHLPLAALFLLPACFVLALAARDRRVGSLLVSTGGAIVVIGLSLRADRLGPRSVTVLDLDSGSDLALEVRGSFAEASVEAADLGRTALSVVPVDARVVWTGSFAPGTGWSARAAGAALYVMGTIDGRPALARDENRWIPLAETWLREEGEWTARGAWVRGSALPPTREGPPPPGWLAAGLPQGISVLLARVEPVSGDPKEVWIRFTGF